MAERWWRHLLENSRPLRWLSPAQRALLCALAAGRTLKGHRYLDGRKAFRLYDATTLLYDVPAADVAVLQRRRLLNSNMKFPAATFFLSPRGAAAARTLCAEESNLP